MRGECIWRVCGSHFCQGVRVVVGAADVGVVELEEWSCGYLSAYIFLPNGIFNLKVSIVSRTYYSWK